MQQLRGAGWEPLGSGSSLSVWVSAFCSWMMGVWVPWDVTEGAGCLGWRPMAFIRPMSLSGLRPERLTLKPPGIADQTTSYLRCLVDMTTSWAGLTRICRSLECDWFRRC